MNIRLDSSLEFPWGQTELDRALSPNVLMGMPHLTPFGLSESWLLKELGHRHWLLVARAANMEDADFRDREGREVYAAISALSMNGVKLLRIKANSVLTISSSVRRISRTQCWSRHDLEANGTPAGSVEMISTFVVRAREGDNHSIARVSIDGLPEIDQRGFPQVADALRSKTAAVHFGFHLDQTEVRARKTFEPDVVRDFNGAGLLYFSNFPAIADGIIRQELGFYPAQLESFDRDVFYAGNLNAGDIVDVELVSAKLAGRDFGSYVRILRHNGAQIASIYLRGRTCG